MKKNKTILITIDLEDWFQVENFKPYINYSEWPNKELRFEKNTYKLLQLFEDLNIKTTFFILGWCAKRAPQLVKEIQQAGHEIASHGFGHKLCHETSTTEFKNDIYKSKCLLEDITGMPVLGYRAPSFSINAKAIELLRETGYHYDSSYNSFGLNKRYGTLDLEKGWEKKDYGLYSKDNFWELPISNIKIFNKIFPWGGGGFFRLYPQTIFLKGVSRLLAQEKHYLFYLHPWEIDPSQPRVPEANPLFKFRHYYNQKKCLEKLRSLILKHKGCVCFKTCSQYLHELSSV